MRPLVLHKYDDPGHGWLKVRQALLDELGIAGLISSCSYQRGDHAYLEEDGDLSLFVRAIEARGTPYTVRSHYCDNDSGVRRFHHYDALPPLLARPDEHPELLAAHLALRETNWNSDAYHEKRETLHRAHREAVERFVSALEAQNV